MINPETPRDPYTTPAYLDVDIGISDGMIQIYGDGGLLIANLPGDRAFTLICMLEDAIEERTQQELKRFMRPGRREGERDE